MKITFEQLDRGILVTAEDNGVLERLAYEDPVEAFSAVGQALGLGVPRGTSVIASRAPVAPSPDVEYQDAPVASERAAPQETHEERNNPPATRRIGLSQPKKSAPPAGRLGAR